MSALPYTLIEDDPRCPSMGLIVLEADETIETEFKAHFADHPAKLYAARIPSAPDVTPETLSAMEGELTHAARLLPQAAEFAVIGYGCTSASSIIGSQAVAAHIKRGRAAAHVTDPLLAATSYARHLGLSKLALVSPYIEPVNRPLMAGFAKAGITMDVFGSFEIAQEASVVRIAPQAIYDAAMRLGQDAGVEGVFLSCTNLRSYGLADQIAQDLGKPVYSSNSALAWHMKTLWSQAVEVA